MTDPDLQSRAAELEKENARLRELNAELVDACKMALAAFEKNNAMDWGRLAILLAKSEKGGAS
jgi:hypothetical protein